jgi:hypothetical protein
MFQIENPAAPAASFLNHYSLEAPKPNTLYSGNVRTDEAGFATVQLPGYFQELNKDFRYNLTVIGTFAKAIVKEKIGDGNSFVIQTDVPDVEVSWTIIATRDDPYMRAHRRPTVQPKTGAAKGKYLHPELYGQPEDKALYQSRNTVVNEPRQQPSLEQIGQRPQQSPTGVSAPGRAGRR